MRRRKGKRKGGELRLLRYYRIEHGAWLRRVTTYNSAKLSISPTTSITKPLAANTAMQRVSLIESAKYAKSLN